jgi:hypothetical protein
MTAVPWAATCTATALREEALDTCKVHHDSEVILGDHSSSVVLPRV